MFPDETEAKGPRKGHTRVSYFLGSVPEDNLLFDDEHKVRVVQLSLREIYFDSVKDPALRTILSDFGPLLLDTNISLR